MIGKWEGDAQQHENSHFYKRGTKDGGEKEKNMVINGHKSLYFKKSITHLHRVLYDLKRTKFKECKEEGGRGKGAEFEINR